MSGKPFDEKAKQRLAKHILSGGREPAEDAEQKVPTLEHAAGISAQAGDTATANMVGKLRSAGPDSSGMGRMRNRIERMGAGRKI